MSSTEIGEHDGVQLGLKFLEDAIKAAQHSSEGEVKNLSEQNKDQKTLIDDLTNHVSSLETELNERSESNKQLMEDFKALTQKYDAAKALIQRFRAFRSKINAALRDDIDLDKTLDEHDPVPTRRQDGFIDMIAHKAFFDTCATFLNAPTNKVLGRLVKSFNRSEKTSKGLLAEARALFGEDNAGLYTEFEAIVGR